MYIYICIYIIIYVYIIVDYIIMYSYLDYYICQIPKSYGTSSSTKKTFLNPVMKKLIEIVYHYTNLFLHICCILMSSLSLFSFSKIFPTWQPQVQTTKTDKRQPPGLGGNCQLPSTALSYLQVQVTTLRALGLM